MSTAEGNKILLVDDSLIVRKSLSNQLQHFGYEIQTAESGAQALSIIAQETFDCVILDLHMNDMNGYEVMEALKKAGNKVPVIVLTADMQSASQQIILALGARGYLNKPIDPNLLHQAIQNAIS